MNVPKVNSYSTFQELVKATDIFGKNFNIRQYLVGEKKWRAFFKIQLTMFVDIVLMKSMYDSLSKQMAFFNVISSSFSSTRDARVGPDLSTTEHIRHRCKKTTVLSCLRRLIYNGIEKINNI
jgi:hypothetical protein